MSHISIMQCTLIVLTQ